MTQDEYMKQLAVIEQKQADPSPARPNIGNPAPDMSQALVAAQPVPQLPTQEISPEALDELFQRDPKKISDEEFEKIVLHYRSQRGRFIQAEREAQQQGKKQSRMPKQKAIEGPKEPKAKLDIKLTDLNLASILGKKE